MKIIISEAQYQHLFNKDILNIFEQKVDGISGAAILSNSPDAGYRTYLRTSGVGDVSSEGEWTWLSKSKAPESMSFSLNPKNSIKGNADRIKLAFKFWDDDKINNNIRTYNSVASEWNQLKVLGDWSGKVLNLNAEAIDNYGLETISNWFNTPYKTPGVGIENTNLFYTEGLIKDYFNLLNKLEDDFRTQLKQTLFIKKQEELKEEYNKKVREWEKEWDKWYKIYGKKYDELMSVILDVENSQRTAEYINWDKNSLANVADNTRVDNSYLNFNPVYTEYNSDDIYNSDVEENNIINHVQILQELNDKIGEIKIPQKLTKIENIKKFQDWLDKNYPKWTASGGPLNKKIPGYGNFGPRTKKAWKYYGASYWYDIKGMIKPPPPKPIPFKIKDLTSRVMEEKSNAENTLDLWLHIIEATTEHNKRFQSQSDTKYREFCSKSISSSRAITPELQNVRDASKGMGFEIPFVHDWLYGELDELDQGGTETFFKICDDYNLGGTWFYSGGKNLGSCGCVHNPEKPLEVGKFKYNMSAIVQNGVQTNDIRSGWEKFTDWAEDCIGDYHCVADIASIAVLFIPVPGLNVALSAAIDLANATSYMIEGKEGWQVDASLTLLGAIFTGVEALKFSKNALKGGYKSAKWAEALGKSVKELGGAEFKGLTKAKAAEKWKKVMKETLGDLSAADLKQLDDVLSAFQKMDKAIIDDYAKIANELGKLNKVEKEAFDKILTKAKKDPSKLTKFAKDIEASNYNIKKVLSKYSIRYNTKQAFIQATIFGVLQSKSSEIAEWLVEAVGDLTRLTGLPVDKWVGLTIDANPNDAASQRIKTLFEDMDGYHYFANGINISAPYISKLLIKYGINIDKDIKDIVFNGVKSITDNQILEIILMEIDDITRQEKKMVENGNTKEEIKKYITDEYNNILKFVEKESKNNELLELLKKESEKDENQVTDEEKEKIDSFLQNDDIMNIYL